MSSIQLVLVYKLLFCLDPNWIPSPYVISCLECVGRLWVELWLPEDGKWVETCRS